MNEESKTKVYEEEKYVYVFMGEYFSDLESAKSQRFIAISVFIFFVSLITVIWIYTPEKKYIFYLIFFFIARELVGKYPIWFFVILALFLSSLFLEDLKIFLFGIN